MDLYEALKAGTSYDELMKKFHEELDDANDRLTKERTSAKEAEEKALELADCRTYLADAIIEYWDALYNERPLSLLEVENILKEWEKEIGNNLSFLNSWNEFLTKENTKNVEKKPVTVTITNKLFDDFDIFTKFINNLK